MKKTFSFIAVLFLIVLIHSCGNNQEESEKNNPEIEYESINEDSLVSYEADSSISDQNKKYGVKSGVLTQKTAVMGFSQTIITHFDDWGNKQISEIDDEVMGQRIHNKTIIIGDMQYEIDMLKKTGTKKKITIETHENLNFMQLTKEMKDFFNITELDKEKILDRECTVYSLNYEDKNDGSLIEAKIWVWKGLSLKLETKVMGVFGADVETTSIKTNVIIPDDVFAIPEGIKWTEVNIKIST